MIGLIERLAIALRWGSKPHGIKAFLTDRSALRWMYLVHSWNREQANMATEEEVQGDCGRHGVKEPGYMGPCSGWSHCRVLSCGWHSDFCTEWLLKWWWWLRPEILMSCPAQNPSVTPFSFQIKSKFFGLTHKTLQDWGPASFSRFISSWHFHILRLPMFWSRWASNKHPLCSGPVVCVGGFPA